MSLDTNLEELQTLAEKLTPAQRRQAAADLGIDKDVARDKAKDDLKTARRRHEGKLAALQVEQRRFAEVEQVERQSFEHRLATLRKPLDAAEHDFAEAEQVLAAAELDLAAAVAAAGQQTG